MQNNALFIQISFTNIANFIHEITHCDQFLNGDIGFDMFSNGSYVDVYDELDAYEKQYYYDPKSLPVNDKQILTVPWLLNITNEQGNRNYLNHGQISYNGNATWEDMLLAYSTKAPPLSVSMVV